MILFEANTGNAYNLKQRKIFVQNATDSYASVSAIGRTSVVFRWIFSKLFYATTIGKDNSFRFKRILDEVINQWIGYFKWVSIYKRY